METKSYKLTSPDNIDVDWCEAETAADAAYEFADRKEKKADDEYLDIDVVFGSLKPDEAALYVNGNKYLISLEA